VGDLLHRGATRGDHGRAARHRFQDGNPETLVERRVRDAGRATVETRKLRIVDLAEPADAVPADVDPAPASGTDDPQLPVGAADCLDETLEVLARFERPDGEHVVPALRWAVTGELVADGVGHYPDLLVRHSEQL